MSISYVEHLFQVANFCMSDLNLFHSHPLGSTCWEDTMRDIFYS
jgi:hypothetical protein